MNSKQMNKFLEDKKVEERMNFITIDQGGFVYGHISHPKPDDIFWEWKIINF